ncbi:MAG: hypothetical protein ACI4OL_07950 [Gemmiger sp.]
MRNTKESVPAFRRSARPARRCRETLGLAAGLLFAAAACGILGAAGTDDGWPTQAEREAMRGTPPRQAGFDQETM